MILCDVNVYLFGYFEQSKHHDVCYTRLSQLLTKDEPFAVSELVLAAVVRIGSNPKLFKPTPSAAELFEFCQTWLDDERAVSVQPAARHWRLFRDLVDQTGVCGSETTDAYLAALAMEHNCEWWSTDSDFGRFPGLRFVNLLTDTR
jgi:toxin-antitoxin system PIN domain toxin